MKQRPQPGRFILAAAARADLREISDYIRQDSPAAAKSFFSVYRYLVIYRTGTDPLEVVRVLHGARDVRRILEG